MEKGLRVIASCFTNQCNLCCQHCGSKNQNKSPEQELAASFLLDVLNQGREMGARQVNLTGGEVFVRPDCFELIEGALDLGYYVSIESNGTLLDRGLIERLASYREDEMRLSVSLDGYSPESNDSIRGMGSFDKTMTALGLLSKTNIPTRVITVLHEGNLHEIPEMATAIADHYGMGYRLIPSIMEYGRGVYACHQIGANWEQIDKVLSGFFYQFLIDHHDDRHSVELNPALVPIEVDYHHVCPWGLSMIGVGPTGLAGLCHVGINDDRFVAGDLTCESLQEIWDNSLVLQRFKSLSGDQLKGVCGNCLAREMCRGGCRVHAISKYGDFLAPSPQCQAVYNLGRFPEYALEIDGMDCSYEPEEE